MHRKQYCTTNLGFFAGAASSGSEGNGASFISSGLDWRCAELSRVVRLEDTSQSVREVQRGVTSAKVTICGELGAKTAQVVDGRNEGALGHVPERT